MYYAFSDITKKLLLTSEVTKSLHLRSNNFLTSEKKLSTDITKSLHQEGAKMLYLSVSEVTKWLHLLVYTLLLNLYI